MNAGIVAPFAGPFEKIPNGWELCDGTSRNRTDSKYEDLFDAIGTTYGGDGVDGFYLPDFRGLFLRGVNLDRNDKFADPGREEREYAAEGKPNPGNNKNHVGSMQDDAFMTHTHPLSDPGHSHAVGVGKRGGNDRHEMAQHGTHYYGMSTHAGTSAVGTGISMGHIGDKETHPANAYVLWIIKL